MKKNLTFLFRNSVASLQAKGAAARQSFTNIVDGLTQTNDAIVTRAMSIKEKISKHSSEVKTLEAEHRANVALAGKLRDLLS